jgi:hypothetical protein
MGDIAEELVEMAETYIAAAQVTEDGETADPVAGDPPAPMTPPGATTSAPSPEENAGSRTLAVDDDFGQALNHPKNKKKQEFKILAILLDAKNRELKPLSAKETSEHGKKLGLTIRHENVRKVIRMRLDEYVEIMIEDRGNGSIYKYRLSDAGKKYFLSKFMTR